MAKDWLGDLLVGGVGGLFDYFGARQQAGATKEAAKIQAETAEKALKQQQGQYDVTRADLERTYQQQRADEAPYLGLGVGAVGALQYGLGLTPPKASTAAPPITKPGAPVPLQTQQNQWWADRLPGARAGVPQGALGMFAGGPQPNSGPANGIPMRSPNGQVTRVAPDQVAHYTQLGAQVV